jgi:putative MATE family efflux protein
MRDLIRIFSDAIQGKEKNFTSGSINRAIVMLSIPMVLEMVMESLFAVVDVFFVSRVGVEAVAIVGLTESVITLVYALAMGVSMAAAAMVSRRIGEGDHAAAGRAALQAIYLGLSVSALIALFGGYFAPDILRLMGGDESLVATGAGYTRVMMLSNVAIMLLFLLNGIFRGAGDAALAMRSLWLANGINIVLDPILIFGLGPFPELGVLGAAYATAIGRSIGVLYQLYHLLGGKSIVPFPWRQLRVHWPVVRRLLDVASTGAGQFLIASASWVFLMRIIAIFGNDAVAGYTIAIRIIVFTILPSWGLSNAAATLVGQNLGAGRPERAETSVWRSAFFNMLFLLSVSIVFFIFAVPIIRIFNNEPAVVEAGVLSLRIICLGYVFFAYGMVISQAFNGAGDTRTPVALNFFCFWLMEIPLGYALAVGLGWGLAGVCAAIALSETALAILCILIFRRGKWKTVTI